MKKLKLTQKTKLIFCNFQNLNKVLKSLNFDGNYDGLDAECNCLVLIE